MTGSSTDARVSEIEQRLKNAGIVDALGEAMTLLRLASSFQSRGNSGSFDDVLEAAVQEREARRSLSRIAGFKHFLGLALKLADDVYEPCASSERLVEHVLAIVADRSDSLRILDVGTGAGNLLLAVLKDLPNATGVGIDVNPAAVTLARDNAMLHNLHDRCVVTQGDAHDVTDGCFDLVISTLPWVPSGQIQQLMPEVRLHDPHQALDLGRDGLMHFKKLSHSLDAMLSATGSGFFSDWL